MEGKVKTAQKNRSAQSHRIPEPRMIESFFEGVSAREKDSYARTHQINDTERSETRIKEEKEVEFVIFVSDAVVNPRAVSVHLSKIELEAVTYFKDAYTTLAAVMGAFGSVAQIALAALGVGFPFLRL